MVLTLQIYVNHFGTQNIKQIIQSDKKQNKCINRYIICWQLLTFYADDVFRIWTMFLPQQNESFVCNNDSQHELFQIFCKIFLMRNFLQDLFYFSIPFIAQTIVTLHRFHLICDYLQLLIR